MPVAVAPVQRQLDSGRRKFLVQCREQRTILRIDRADAAKMIIMLRDLQHSLARHVSAAKHVFQKRQHILAPLRTAKRNQQKSVVLHPLILPWPSVRTGWGSGTFVVECN